MFVCCHYCHYKKEQLENLKRTDISSYNRSFWKRVSWESRTPGIMGTGSLKCQPSPPPNPRPLWVRGRRRLTFQTMRNLVPTVFNGIRYCQIRCIAPRVLQTSKGFWVFLFRQSSEWMRSYANHNTTRSPISRACEMGEKIIQRKIQRSCRLGEVLQLLWIFC